jgi:aspartate carbamoyltransferase catalytic subunit
MPVLEPSYRGLLGLQGMPASSIRRRLTDAREMAERPHTPTLAGRIIANLFFEDSTRTRTSFSIAAKRLGAEVVDLLGGTTSVNKGETLVDTALNIEAMGVAALVVRARQAGAAEMIARAVRCPVINAGDGRHEHPTQALLDIFTIAQAHNRSGDFDLSGLKIAIVGDVGASRVARSNIAGMTALGAEVFCVGPPAMVPGSVASLGARVARNLDQVLPALDAVVMLRIQFERYTDGHSSEQARKSAPISTVREFRQGYGLHALRVEAMKPGAVVMHPGPINRGIELDTEVAEGPRSVILRQVANGVPVRMAVLERAVLA